MLRKAMAYAAMSLVFTAIGLLGGRAAWKPKAEAAAPPAAAMRAPTISKQALLNLGVEIGELSAAPWTRTVGIPATVESLPESVRTLTAPAAGTVLDAPHRAGTVVSPADVLLTIRGEGDSAVAAPAGAPDWDLVEMKVNAGDRVEAGTPVAVLRDARAVRLRARTAGTDAEVLLRALKEGTACEAVPMVGGSGPALKGLKLLFADNAAGERATAAVAEVPNEVLAVRDDGDGGKVRTWALREGQRYLLRVPMETVKQVYVVPQSALAVDGADRVVYLQDGDSFLARRVVVLHEDADVAVLASKNSEVFPGDVYVRRGAFGLGLAMKAAMQSVIGHGHVH
ncbi:MAG: HlyD family secretion protein [Planctomycetes bacterium]|nr:HlyD family secretion protein [Planctomycetota bacterium]